MHKLCTRCHVIAKPAYSPLRKALDWVGVVLVLAGIAYWPLLPVAAVVFAVSFTRPRVCMRCKSTELVPPESPAGQQILAAANASAGLPSPGPAAPPGGGLSAG